ncbi:MAG TPA: KUP/HAK/KT family potassium transporter, partial [Rhizomicrobium sp.]|nr:KUP/HAK/KT family potassium transporter [Rhizomicrobium sp.]
MASGEPTNLDDVSETGDPLVSPSDPLAAADNDMPPPPATLHAKGRTALLALGALGVVFGDIGTSPLYAMRETVLATTIGHGSPGPIAVMGGLSLIIWALIIVVTLKYVVIIMRADNNGEGGVLALATRAHRSPGLSRKVKTTIGIAAILGLALFYGDGMLTPAITVLSAVEGLTVQSHEFEPLVMPLAIIILVLLFAIQSRGTAKIGRLFGPIMLLWFGVLSVLGVISIMQAPQILLAVNPYYAFVLIGRAPWTAFVALGSVVLAVTGCEALYADMGHFGKRPIRLAWLVIALPALLMDYFGQGAAILVHPNLAPIAFYSVVPASLHYPMVILATMASIIASQAVISGVFSMTRQAVQLGQLPRMEIRHTSATDYGQIYVPRMNAFLLVGVVLIVLIFRSSAALAAAYGIAVTGVMVIDTFHVSLVALRQWKWKLQFVVGVFGLLAIIDILFLASNALKIPEGGWLPLLIAAGVFFVMETWRLGRRLHQERIRNESMPLDLFLERADKTP